MRDDIADDAEVARISAKNAERWRGVLALLAVAEAEELDDA